MQLNQCFLRGLHDSEFTKSHLKHHIFTKLNFLSNHDESSSSRPNISYIKLRIGRISTILRQRLWAYLLIICILDVLYFTVTAANEALADDDVITGGMSTKSCSIGSNDIHIVQKLTFYCFEHQNIHILDLIELVLIVLIIVGHKTAWLYGSHVLV